MNRQEKEKAAYKTGHFAGLYAAWGQKNRKGSPAQLFAGQNCPFLGG